MKKLLFLAIVTYLMVACMGNHASSQREPQSGDTLYTAEAAMDIYDQDPNRALVIIDSALLVGNVDDDLATMLKAKIYCHSNMEQHLDTARQMLEGLLESDFYQSIEYHEVVLDLLVSITRQQDNYEQCLRWATEKADYCRQLGKETEALRTEAEIGVILVELGEEEKGIAKLNGVIASLEGQRQTDEMDACVIAIRRKINVLKKLNRVEEVIPLSQHLIEMINDYREHYNQYTDNSYRMPTDKDEVEGYCDYYTAQANAYLAYAYAVMNNTKQARHYLELFENSDYGRSLYGRENIAPTWCLLGDFDKMLATYDEVMEQMGNDTINLDYAKMLRGRAIAAQAMDNPSASADYWQRYAELKDLLHKQLQESKAHEYAARYQLQEERLNTEREQAAKKRIELIAALLGIMLLMVAIFVLILVRQLRSIREKNAVLIKEISDRIANEEKYRASIEKQADLSTLNDSELYEYLHRFILKENLHLNPLFDRQMLMDQLHLPKERIGAAFSKGSQYASLAAFVNEMRLIHGAKLLIEHPDMSISDVATASGFASNITFAHNFRERYAISPSNFREEKRAQLA